MLILQNAALVPQQSETGTQPETAGTVRTCVREIVLGWKVKTFGSNLHVHVPQLPWLQTAILVYHTCTGLDVKSESRPVHVHNVHTCKCTVCAVWRQLIKC